MREHPDTSVPMRAPASPRVAALQALKAHSRKIVMVTAYDFVTARVAARAGGDVVLVGDSAANTVLGYSATREVTLDEMLILAAAARRGLTAAGPSAPPLLVGDMPWGTYETSDDAAVETARRFHAVGCDAVKLEGGGPTSVARAQAISRAGIPVMGHVGLTPQTATALGGYRAQARNATAATRIAREALALQEAGCFSIVFEAIPAAVCEELMYSMEIPVIGIGAGPSTDGQVLVFHDLLGIREGLGARFVKRYASLQEDMDAGVAAFADDVRERRYPAPEHTYSIDPGELADFRQRLTAS